MTKVFIDTNIFLDFLLDRIPFSDSAETLLNLCAEGKINGVTSAINIVNIYYIIRRQKTQVETIGIIRRLLGIITVIETSHKDLLLTCESEYKDFEDTVQYYTSLNVSGLNYLITRNKIIFILQFLF